MTVLWWIISGTIAAWFLLNGAVAVILAFKGRQRLRPNFVRGLLRAWLVLSLCWVGYVGVQTWKDLPTQKSASRADFVITGSPWITTALADMKRWRAEQAPPRYKSVDDWPDYDPTKDRHSLSYLPTEQDRQDAIIDGVKWALIPPMIVLAAGIMIGWIIRGFGRRERRLKVVEISRSGFGRPFYWPRDSA